ncbi:uncharacterized protein VTP21DRAFT_7602 [Calcarisporiella thermophila]|uniref:uncharacterized protein n=1 Tax=Calcarisporiella thermophila TaxID=911321 RepID=UPI003742BB17
MGKKFLLDREDVLKSKFRDLYDSVAEKIHNEEGENLITFNEFSESLDVNDKTVKKLFEILVKETAHKLRLRHHPYNTLHDPRLRTRIIPHNTTVASWLHTMVGPHSSAGDNSAPSAPTDSRIGPTSNPGRSLPLPAPLSVDDSLDRWVRPSLPFYYHDWLGSSSEMECFEPPPALDVRSPTMRGSSRLMMFDGIALRRRSSVSRPSATMGQYPIRQRDGGGGGARPRTPLRNSGGENLGAGLNGLQIISSPGNSTLIASTLNDIDL